MDERQIGPTNFSNLAVGIGWLRVAENWAVLKNTKKKRGRAVGTTTLEGYTLEIVKMLKGKQQNVIRREEERGGEKDSEGGRDRERKEKG